METLKDSIKLTEEACKACNIPIGNVAQPEVDAPKITKNI